MEDCRHRLKFADVTVRTRCVQKLVRDIKKKSVGTIINASSKPIPELSLLWETCLSDSPTTSDFVVQGIVHLVISRNIEASYAINQFLGYISSSSNIHAVVKGISKILIHQYKQKNSNDSTPLYALNYPKHPLITILQNNEDYLPLLLENIANAIIEENTLGFQAMEPIISYLLYCPVKKMNYSKVLLLETLIDTVKIEPKTSFYILRCLPYLQVETYEHVSEASKFILKAKQVFSASDFSERDHNYISELFLLSSLSLTERCFALGHDSTQLLNLIIEISSSLVEKSFASTYINVYLTLVSLILKSVTNADTEKVASIAMTLLKFKAISPTVAGFLAFSVIQLLQTNDISFSENAKSILPHFLKKLEQYFLSLDDSDHFEQSNNENCLSASERKNPVLIEAFTFTVESALLSAQFAQKLDQSKMDFKLHWMKSLQAHIAKSNSNNTFDTVFAIVASLFLGSPDNQEYLSTCLDTFEAILLKNNYLSTQMFALLLYKQNILKSPESKFLVLSFLPKSATHKYAIPPVINTIVRISIEPELKAFSIHLMLELWKRHDRIFSYLHKQLLESSKFISKDTNINETLISQATAIKEICLTVPEKHGSEFLGTLSKIFNEANDDASSPAACLALDGVINLCKAEIIDVRSTWKLLGPKLIKDKRTAVACRMFELLSLIPELKVDSPQFHEFMKEIVSKVWKQIISGTLSSEAESEAYKALAKFPFDCHELKQLPPGAKINLTLPPSLKSTPFEMGKLPEDVLTYVPGYVFVDLMKSIDNEIILDGYSEFLSSIIQQEVSTLPRSVYSQRKQVQKRQNSNEALLKVPKFLCSQFEARKSPALQKNIAFGVLLCYEPPLEINKDGEPVKRSVASQSRFFEQVLGILLNEVNIDATEWQRAILLPGAWGGFMERAFFACEDSRKVELELQRSLGHLEVSSEEFQVQCKTAWLWVRDRLMNLIKTCVKNAPTSHANAVFAISGLVRASIKFYATLDDASKTLSDDMVNYIKHDVFIIECTETILCALKKDHIPNGKVHSWLLTHLSRPNSSSGYLVRGCSCASLYHLTAILLKYYSNDIPLLISELTENLSHNSPVLNFYSGIGLGLLIRTLCEVGYPDNGDMQAELLINTAKDIFNLYSNEESPSVSLIICLTVLLTGLSQISNEDYKDWSSTTSDIFYEKLMDEEVSSMNYEALSICVSAMMISAAEGSCINTDRIITLTNWFDDRQSETPQCSGTSVALGMLNESLERFGCTKLQSLKQRLQKEWLNTLSSEKRPTLHRLAALNGLCSLYSCGRGLLQIKSKASNTDSVINDIISLMFQLLTATRDTGLQNICSWEVGRLFSVHSFNQETEESVPSSYHYLNEKSTLKYVIKTIIESYNNEEFKIKQCHLLCCLKSINSEFNRPLPPLNWPTVFSSFLQNVEETQIIELVLKILIQEGKNSPQAINLLSSYCSPPLIHSLPEKIWKHFLRSIPCLTATLPVSKLQIFLQTIISTILKSEEKFLSLGNYLMQGITKGFELKNLKQQSIKVQQDAFITIFNFFKKDISLVHKHLSWICSGFLCLPDKRMTSILDVAKNNCDIAVLTLIWCFFVKTGKKSLSSLHPCVEEGKHATSLDKEYICAAIYDCFLGDIDNKETDLKQSEKCISWLLETIGFINILNDSKSKFQLLSVREVFIFLNDVCMATLLGCAGIECSYNFLPIEALTHHMLEVNLPSAITKLCKNDKWLKVMNKIIDWFVMLLQTEHLEENDKHFIKLCLCSMRNLGDFQNTEIWTNVISNIY